MLPENFGAKEKALKKLEPESKDYWDAVSSLASERNKAQQAAMEIRNIKSMIAEITKKNTSIKKQLNKMNNLQFAKEKMERYTKLNSMIKVRENSSTGCLAKQQLIMPCSDMEISS